MRAAGRSGSILQETKAAVNIEKMGVEARVFQLNYRLMDNQEGSDSSNMRM